MAMTRSNAEALGLDYDAVVADEAGGYDFDQFSRDQLLGFGDAPEGYEGGGLDFLQGAKQAGLSRPVTINGQQYYEVVSGPGGEYHTAYGASFLPGAESA